MENKEIFIEVKQLSDEGTFEGLLSPYGNLDQGGDIVEPGAYTKTIKEGGPTRPLLWQHKDPIGELTLEDRKEGLWVKGRLLLELQQAKDAHALMKAGIVKGLSIGYRTMKDEIQKGTRYLKELKLMEGSIVTFPMNAMALINAVKGLDPEGQKSAIAMIKRAGDEFKNLLALLVDEAGIATSDQKAAANTSEPEDLHSVGQALSEIRALIPA